MEKLSPLFWLCGVALAYVALGQLVVAIRNAIHTRSYLPLLVDVPVAVAAVYWMVSGAPESLPLRLVIAMGVITVVVAALRAVSPKPTPKQMKEGREGARQTYLHLVLLTGAVVFMVPFVWLVSTSLKDDEDIFTNEIRIIPQRPVTFKRNGKDLTMVTVDGAKLAPGQKTVRREDDDGNASMAPLFAQLADNEDTISVAPILLGNGLGRESSVNPDGVHKVKKPGIVWENYPKSLQYLPDETHHGLVYLGNTLFITAMSIIGTLLTASMVAFAFARLRWPGKDGLFILLLSTMMLPYAVTMIPQFLIWQKLGFFNTLVPLWAGAFLGGGAFNIFLLRQFFMTIPSELEEAAKIDGCSYWRTFWTIMLPLVRPAMATVAIMTFMGSWNNFMGPLIYISSPTKMPVAYALQLYQSVHGGEFGLLMAASTMVMIPVLLVFFFCQRYFIQGITLTGLKG
ncbi:MAG TPA: carbohydrate ABC transporter permease [Armatimonadota bacterium]